MVEELLRSCHGFVFGVGGVRAHMPERARARSTGKYSLLSPAILRKFLRNPFQGCIPSRWSRDHIQDRQSIRAVSALKTNVAASCAQFHRPHERTPAGFLQ
jgi:hypothetical protein